MDNLHLMQIIEIVQQLVNEKGKDVKVPLVGGHHLEKDILTRLCEQPSQFPTYVLWVLDMTLSVVILTY